MIAVPMLSAQDDVIAVIQLINKKRDPKKKLVTPEDALGVAAELAALR